MRDQRSDPRRIFGGWARVCLHICTSCDGFNGGDCLVSSSNALRRATRSEPRFSQPTAGPTYVLRFDLKSIPSNLVVLSRSLTLLSHGRERSDRGQTGHSEVERRAESCQSASHFVDTIRVDGSFAQVGINAESLVKIGAAFCCEATNGQRSLSIARTTTRGDSNIRETLPAAELAGVKTCLQDSERRQLSVLGPYDGRRQLHACSPLGGTGVLSTCAGHQDGEGNE